MRNAKHREYKIFFTFLIHPVGENKKVTETLSSLCFISNSENYKLVSFTDSGYTVSEGKWKMEKAKGAF